MNRAKRTLLTLREYVMADTSSSRLQLWEGGAQPLLAELSALGNAAPPALTTEFAHRLYQEESLTSGHSARRIEKRPEPCTLQWFLDIETLRHRKYGRWIPRALEFTKHAGERLLGVGVSLGTDWLQYAQHGAHVVGCGPSREHLALARYNFELRGFDGQFLHAPFTALPVGPASIDVVCLSQLPTDPDERDATIEEVYRVLKPGGKVLAVVPAHFDVELWRRWLLPLFYAWGGLRASMERTTPSYTARRLKRHFGRFVEHRVHKRHLRRADLPHLWRVVSVSCLERLIGRCLVLKAFKPLSAAMATSLAA